MKIFYSWQSDRPQTVCRNFIREAIEEALLRIYAEMGLDEAQRPELDHDTKDSNGWVEITNTILQKIAACAVFIGDVTPVAKTADHGKEVPNPNVTTELGYALRAVGGGRIVLVANTAYGATSPEKLPFNMRHRSAPASYKLKKDATDEERAAAKTELVDQLVDWIAGCLKEALDDQPAAAVPWRAGQPSQPGIWFDNAVGLKHQNFFGQGNTMTVSLVDGPRSYVRLLPSGWAKGVPSRDQVHNAGNNLMLTALGRWQDGDGGMNADGTLAYAVIGKEVPRVTTTMTQYFKDTGEVWGVDASALAEHGGKMWLPTTHVLQQWSLFMGRRLALYHHFGAKAPIHVQIGVTGLADSMIFSFNRPAIDESFEFHDTLKNFSEAEQMRVLVAAYNKMREAYGVGPVQSMEDHVNDIGVLLFHPPREEIKK